jgi:uncharacterized protein (DUF427 family)
MMMSYHTRLPQHNFKFARLSFPKPNCNSKLKLETMVKVTLNGTVIADSNNTVTVENNYYFPPGDVKTDLFSLSTKA